MHTIVFDSEKEFRKYLIKNYKDIINVILLEDKLENIIFFYSFTNNNLIIASKHSSTTDFEFFYKIYQKLIEKLELNIEYTTSDPKCLKLSKNI